MHLFLPYIIKRLGLVDNYVAFWASVAIVKMSYNAAFTNYRKRKCLV